MFMACMWFSKRMIFVTKEEWDMLTVTASDYTLEIPLTDEICWDMVDFVPKDSFTDNDSEEH